MMTSISIRLARTSAFPAVSRRTIASSSKNAKATELLFASTKDMGKAQPFRMLMLAKPGSGKGTLSGRLMDKYDISFLSTGDVLRQHIKNKTEIGKKAESIVAAGGLLPDDLMLKLLSSNLESVKGKNWILDGFPRTLPQAETLDRHLDNISTPLNLVVNLDVPDEIIMARISERWIHPASGRIYNYSYNRPKVEGVDDVTGEPLVRRPDDNPETFQRRLKAYYESTAPLLAYYKNQSSPSKLVSLSGKTSDEIWPQLDAIIQSRFRLRLKNSVPEAVIRQVEKEISRPAREVPWIPVIPDAM